MPADLILRVAATQALDLEWLEKLRKDFLTLMKNLPRVKTYADGSKLRDGFKVYKARFSDLFFDRFLNKQLKYGYEEFGISESDAQYIERKLRKTGWDLYVELNLPLPYKGEYMTEEFALAKFEREHGTWEARVKRKAQIFWKDLREVITWVQQRPNRGLSVKTPTIEVVAIEGFKVQVTGYEPDDADVMEKFKAGLRLYKKNAGSRLPLLLKKQLPLLLTFEAHIDKGGEYHSRGGGEIEFFASGIINETPGRVAWILAHEMGHHLFKTWLGGDGREFWTSAIMGNYGPLNIADVLRVWPGDAWAFELSKLLANVDPIIALQIQAYSYDKEHHNAGNEVQTKEYFQALLDSGTKTINVPKIPITGYANKNPEEAFCEAIGLLVAYGPQAVHEVIRDWLSIVLPGQVKIATDDAVIEKLAATFLKNAGYFSPGDLVLFGKYKNKKAIIRSISVDDRGVPVVEIEPVPKGRKQNKVLGLFNIWHADPEKRKSFGT